MTSESSAWENHDATYSTDAEKAQPLAPDAASGAAAGAAAATSPVTLMSSAASYLSAAKAEADPVNFSALASRLSDNLAAATLRLVDAGQDFAGLIQAYVSAGQELEKSLAAIRDLTAANQDALRDAKAAAIEAAGAAAGAHGAQQSAFELVERSTREHVALAELTDALRQRIAALSVLGAPMPRASETANLLNHDAA